MSVESQLRGYQAHFEAEVSDVSLDDVTAPRRARLQPAKPPTTRRIWVVVLASALAVLVSVGGVALLVGRGEETIPVVTEPSGPDTTVVATSGGWAQVASADVFGTATVIDGVVVGGPGFVAVGEILDADGRTMGLRGWVSSDGVDWEPINLPSIDVAASTQTRWRLTAGPVGVMLWSIAMSEDEADSGLYFSADGYNWHEVATGPQRIYAIAASDRGFIAIADTPEGTEILTSSDGSSWVSTGGEVPGEVGRFDGVTSWDEGWVAWAWGGFDCTSVTATACDGFWASPDGSVWTELVANAPVFEDASIWDMHEYRDELYAVGEYQAKPAAWVSADGTTWTRVFARADNLGALWGVTAGSDMIVARGSHSEEALDRPDEIWMSTDGRNWRLIGSEDTFGTPALRQLAVSGDRIVAGGIRDWDIWPPPPALLRWTDTE